jgi:hypothetical protein
MQHGIGKRERREFFTERTSGSMPRGMPSCKLYDIVIFILECGLCVAMMRNRYRWLQDTV